MDISQCKVPSQDIDLPDHKTLPVEECTRQLWQFKSLLANKMSKASSELGVQMVESFRPMSVLDSIREMSKTQKVILVGFTFGGFALYVVSSWCRRRRKILDPSVKSIRAVRRARKISMSRSQQSSSNENTLRRGQSQYPWYNWPELQRQSQQIAADQESVTSVATLVDGTPLTPQQLGLMGMEALETVVGYWEDALASYRPKSKSSGGNDALLTTEETKFIKLLENILEVAYQLQEESESLFIHQSSILNRQIPKSDQQNASDSQSYFTPSSSLRQMSRVLSVSSVENESFASAQDTIADLKDFEDLFDEEGFSDALYQDALRHMESNEIPCRAIRTEFVGCSNKNEYLAKLHCIRLAFNQIMSQDDNRQWWVETARQMLSDLLLRSEKDPKEFHLAFDEMVDFLEKPENIELMGKELKARNVKCTNFYDVAIDYLLIESFEDLEAPPSSVLAVMKNRWLSNGFKESALQTAVWSVLKAKRSMMLVPNGFKARFYNISEIVTPTFAWGFLGPDEDQNVMMSFFKDQVMGFIRDLFDSRKVRYATVDTLSDDIMAIAKNRLEATLKYLEDVEQ